MLPRSRPESTRRYASATLADRHRPSFTTVIAPVAAGSSSTGAPAAREFGVGATSLRRHAVGRDALAARLAAGLGTSSAKGRRDPHLPERG